MRRALAPALALLAAVAVSGAAAEPPSPTETPTAGIERPTAPSGPERPAAPWENPAASPATERPAAPTETERPTAPLSKAVQDVTRLLGPWGPPGLADDGWRATPPKSPTLEFVRAQGGLWTTDVPQDAGGRLRTVPGTEEPPRPAERVVSVRVEVERGLRANGAEVARQVMDTLNDPRGWGHDGSVVFTRTDGAADIDITLASPATTDELCAPLPTDGEVSCGREGFAVLNAARWAQGAEPFLEAGGTVAEYRRYLVNHEVGHVLGHPHEDCPAPGAVAPVMLQQTLRLDGCQPNGWPAPVAD